MKNQPANDLIFYHGPMSRSSSVLILLEQLGITYEIELLDLKKNMQRESYYLAINPMGKVPAIVHRGTLITEQAAIFIYLADAFPEAKLAPALDSPKRGEYLRWMIYYGSCFEPAVVDHTLKREPAPLSISPYGSFETMFSIITTHLATHDYILGDDFSAADILWGVALKWTLAFKLIPESDIIKNYIARIDGCPAAISARIKDNRFAAAF